MDLGPKAAEVRPEEQEEEEAAEDSEETAWKTVRRILSHMTCLNLP